MANMAKTSRLPRNAFWKTTPLLSRILFFGGVFSLFSSVGFLYLLLQPRFVTYGRLSATVLVMGGLAVLCAVIGIARKYWLIAIVSVVEGFFFMLMENSVQSTDMLSSSSPARTQIVLLSIGAIVSVVAGYVLFITFFSRQGARFFRAQNEIAMAAEIHRTLVPRIHQTFGAFELFGASVPSGEVGGDLVDVAGDANAWTAYVADVSGHGVSAGLLMAMFKTAVRTRASYAAPDVLLGEVHRALYPLKTNNMFVTAGFLQCTGDELTLSLAGHPAMLHYCKRTGTVEEHPTIDLPLGILPEQTFVAKPLTSAAGDVLLLLTDGFTEVFDSRGNELGVEPIKQALGKCAGLPLPDMFTRLREVALAAGHQDDDQTMLLVRRLPATPAGEP